MPILEMKVPSPGESISEVEIAAWLVSDGDYVFKDQAIAEVDSDKATLELPAEMDSPGLGTFISRMGMGSVDRVGESMWVQGRQPSWNTESMTAWWRSACTTGLPAAGLADSGRAKKRVTPGPKR